MSHYQVYQALFIVNNETISEVEGAFLKLTGYSREHFVHRKFSIVLKDILKATVACNRIKPGQDPVSCFIFSRDLKARAVQLSATAVNGSQSLCYRIEETPGAYPDQELNVLNPVFADNKIGACILSSPDLLLLKANPAFLEMLGSRRFQSSREALGQSLDDLITKDLLPDMKGNLARVIHSGESLYSSKITNISENRHWSTNLIPMFQNHHTKYIIGFFIDISEYALEMQRGRERKKQLEIILENMSDGLIITDNKANVLMMNAAARTYYKKPDDMRALDTCYDKVLVTDMDGTPVPVESMPAHRALRGEKVKNYRIVINRKADQKVFEYNSSPLYDCNGNIIMTLSCSRDVTDQVLSEKMIKAHQEELFKVELEKNEALRKAIALKDEFVSLISHEFKTPISVIIAAVQAMEALCGEQLNERAKGYIRRIRQNAYRQLRLVNNLLDIARISSGQVKLYMKNYDIVFLSSSITESVVPYADQKGIKLLFSSAIKKKMIGLDDEKYERILLNLLSNAIKFTPEGKSVFVRISEKKTKKGRQVCIEVEDEGIGIPEDKQELIFKKFGQIDSMQSPGIGGTGLGLSLAKLYAEVLGGSIALSSHVGKGTCFSLLLPDKLADVQEADAIANLANCPVQWVAVEFSDIYPLG